MQSLGYVLLLLAVVASVFGYLERRKNRRVLATPFRRTGEIAANPRVADAHGNVSCEGPVRSHAPTYAPCSGQPCLYYEIEVIQSWTKFVTTENGVKQERGSSTIDTSKSGVVFFVDDGSGPVAVDPRHGIDVELEKTFEDSQPVGAGSVVFNGFHTMVPDAGEGKIGESVKVIERIVPLDTHMFVLGQLDDCLAISKPLASRRGRKELIRRTKRHATIGMIAGAVFMCPGLALAAFGEPAADDALGSKTCLITDESVAGAPCTGKIYGDYGSDIAFTVTQAGTFEIVGRPPPGKKLPLIPAIDLRDARGRVVTNSAADVALAELVPGTYTINIRDRIPGSAKGFKGGFSYELSVRRLALAPLPPPPAATVLAPIAPPIAKAKPTKKAKKAKR